MVYFCRAFWFPSQTLNRICLMAFGLLLKINIVTNKFSFVHKMSQMNTTRFRPGLCSPLTQVKIFNWHFNCLIICIYFYSTCSTTPKRFAQWFIFSKPLLCVTQICGDLSNWSHFNFIMPVMPDKAAFVSGCCFVYSVTRKQQFLPLQNLHLVAKN